MFCLLMRIYRSEFVCIKLGACLTIDAIIFVIIFHVEGIDLLGEAKIANGPLGTPVIYLFWNMTANQRKKRVNAASLVGCTSYERYMVKSKKLKLPPPALKMAPTISLEWDNKKKSVVSKRDQIGISQRHWIPFIEPGPHSHIILADVFSVPQEIFELENLSEVLSYEVWRSLLSKNERSLLSQFLPKEAVPDALVQELLAGDNFHFGNPFLIWGASLCFGELHPDNVLREEESLKACKKVYYSHLRKYHNDMIGNVLLWKEKWSSCEDPEVDIVHKVWRTRNYAEKSVPLSDTEIYDAEENLVATPDSCSWANSEKECVSDNQNREMVHGDFERRIVSFNRTGDSDFSWQEVAAVSRKGGKLHKYNIQRENGAKYMSYVKQHERVKSSMKHAGISIQRRSLNNVLGTIDTLNVQPFEKFEEEEEKKLRDHWLKLVTSDIPDGFIYWRKSVLSRQQLIQSLGEEMGKKVKPEEVTLDWDREGSRNKLMESSDDSKYEFLPAITIEGVEKDQFDDMLSEQRDNELAIDEIETVQQAKKIRKTDYVFEEQAQDTVKIEHGDMPDHVCIKDHHQQQVASIDRSTMQSAKLIESFNPVVPQDKHQQQNGSVNGNLQIKSLDMESLVNSASAEIDDTLTFSTYTGNLSHVIIPVNQRLPLTSASDVWPTGDTRGSYYQSAAASDGYASSQELKLGRTQFMQEQPLRKLDSETDRQDKDAGKDMFPRRSDHTSLFSSYSNQDQREPLPFFNGHNSLSYHHERKHLGVDFQPANDLMDAGQFQGHLTEQVHPSLHLYPKPKRLNDFYLHQTLQESMYSDGNRFNMPKQVQVPVNIHDWAAVNSVSMTATSQPHLNSIELNQNWYSGESGSQDVWAPYESAVHSFSGGRNSDQSLFSVLSECNELRPAIDYDPMSSSERFIQAGNYSGMGGGIQRSSLPQEEAPNAFNYLNGHEAGTAGVKISNLGWMGIPQQNPGIHESSIDKSFLRSWNQ
ncbi:uncharacterized protein [Primulina huaijiensis]|uniref:uncharacterized protein isoform X2 n=1 Tax=Primulina huaijiensis TaxID=1492673 RepID=UPI003CC72A23